MSTPRRTSTLSAVRAASAPHRTATSDASWDGTANEANCPADRTRLRAAFARLDPDGDPDTAAAYSLLHHFVDAEGAVGAASTVACLAAIAALNDSGDSAKREAEWKHLRKHLVDSGLDPADVPPLEAAAEPEALAALHDPMECMHSHDHSTMADGGGTHAHEHQHAGDANHDHPHDPSMMSTEAVTASVYTVDAMVASLSATGSSWGIQQDENDWIVVGRDGEAARFVAESPDADHLRRAANLALARLGELAFADGQAASSAGRFRAEIIPEGVETSDGRTIEPGATRWSRLDSQGTLPVMLQTVTEVGHFGAVLAGRMDAAERAGDVVVASGDFDDSEAGHEFADIVEARGRFGVSVDLIEMEAEFECTQMEDGWCEDGLLRVVSCELGGFTGTPFPAFADAFIELEASAASNAQAASAHRPAARPCRDCGAEQAIVASIPVSPPSGWFAPPELQGPTAMTVTEDGAVFGHAFLWGSCHIGHADVCVTPPRSASGYRSFLVGEVRCADGSTVAVGHLTLGTGHASLSADPRSAAAHYDDTGTVVADVVCGEDAYGGWFAGALRPHVDAEQVRALRASAVSGDWRRIGGTLELVAMLAVNVPGFPVPRARVAGGAQLALVAAGAGPLAVEADPYADALAALEARLTARIARVETVARPLRALAAQAIVASVTPAAEPVPESASA